MMNRSNSTDLYAPPMMSFEPTTQKQEQQQHLWDWDSTTTTTITTFPTTTTAIFPNYPFIQNSLFPDCQPHLFPMANFPSYTHHTQPPDVPDYSIAAALIKTEEGGSGIGTSANRIGLNLGHRTYFSTGDSMAIDRLFARSRGLYALAHQPPRCQAEGCKADLSGAKHYHRRHKVCEFHSKAIVVIAGGLQQRFCQQCSRFHVLSEFDEAKRSCRKRLADHNRRRRKPQSSSTDSSSSASKNTTTSTTTTTTDQHRTKHTTTKNTREIMSTYISTSKATIGSNNNTTMVANGNTSMEMQQGYMNTGTHLRNEPDLSLGGDIGSQNLYDHHHQQQYFHHQNLFCSRSNEASQSTGGGSEQNHHHHHQNSLLHLGQQAMFEVDYFM